MKKLSQNQALELALDTLQKNGATKENAIPLALGIIDAENQGIKSHGFHYLPIYCLHLKCEKVKGSASPKLTAIENNDIWSMKYAPSSKLPSSSKAITPPAPFIWLPINL